MKTLLTSYSGPLRLLNPAALRRRRADIVAAHRRWQLAHGQHGPADVVQHLERGLRPVEAKRGDKTLVRGEVDTDVTIFVPTEQWNWRSRR